MATKKTTVLTSTNKSVTDDAVVCPLCYRKCIIGYQAAFEPAATIQDFFPERRISKNCQLKVLFNNLVPCD